MELRVPRLDVVDVWPAAAFAPSAARPLVLARVRAGFPSPADDHCACRALSCRGTRVRAGFPSPADDHVDAVLSLDDLVGVTAAPATFFVRVEGDSMTDAHICSGDVVVVDRARTPRDGDVVVAALDGEMTIKRLRTWALRGDARLSLVPAHSGYPVIEVSAEQDFTVWGVVTHVVHPVS